MGDICSMNCFNCRWLTLKPVIRGVYYVCRGPGNNIPPMSLEYAKAPSHGCCEPLRFLSLLELHLGDSYGSADCTII